MSCDRHKAEVAPGPFERTALTMGVTLRLAVALVALVPLWLAVWWSLA